MQYKGFHISIKPGIVQRTDTAGNQTDCSGFMIKICDSQNEDVIIDMFTAAVGYELLKNSLSEAEQFAKDYVSTEEKELRKLMDEYHSYE